MARSKSELSLPIKAYLSEVLSTKSEVNLLIGVTGSVAAIKLPKLINHFKDEFKLKFEDKHLNIRVVMTENAGHFFDLNEIQNKIEVYRDNDEWSNWKEMNDPILHIDLRNWADVLLIAPLDANTLAKLANGLCDNLLTCIVRAWNYERKPLFFAPAMNTAMYEHRFTDEHRIRLRQLGYFEIEVIEKRLACGDVGKGVYLFI
jgi:phosphopantothenoylcysteine decarboxylase